MSMSSNIFNSVLIPKPKSSVFDLKHDHKLSLDMGQLVPVMCMDCLPGDRVSIGAECMVRFMPMLAPVMHRFNVSIHYWFVPNRIIWPSWEEFISGPPDADPGYVAPVAPYVTIDDATYTAVADHMGIPRPSNVSSWDVSPLAFAAYQLIWWHWYRDQNLQTADDINEFILNDGDNNANVANLLALRIRAWQHDYFTGALPFAQKGPAVAIPFGEFKDVFVYRATAGGGNNTITSAPSNIVVPNTDSANPTIHGSNFLYAQTSQLNDATTAPNLNDLRRAEQLQKWLEVNARTGNRYVEGLLGHWGVRSSDARLQRPEYITGIKTPVIISEVLNMTGNEGADALPQGNMAGHGVAVAGGKFGSYFCEEHGYIIGIMSVMPVTAYQQGIPRHFSRLTDRFQYAFPEFANIGEQEVLQKELYALSNTPDATFGYVPRYAEYKYIPSMVSGELRTTLDQWQFGRIFDDDPALNSDFVECRPGKRIFAVQEELTPSLVAHVLNKVIAVRKLPKFGIPTL